MKIVFLKHLKLQITERDIPEELVKETLINPDLVTRNVSGTKGIRESIRLGGGWIMNESKSMKEIHKIRENLHLHLTLTFLESRSIIILGYVCNSPI